MSLPPPAYSPPNPDRDSSDSGKVKLWISALESMKSRQDKAKEERKALRTVLKEKIRAALYKDLGVTEEKDAALRALFRRKRLGEAAGRPGKRKAPGLPSDLESATSERQSVKRYLRNLAGEAGHPQRGRVDSGVELG
ncbi:hypothetical protein scyTo_0021423 [Scyliorhinus torazame]|uniref:Uncharacterized protein n=1 Tax=Scyliorhinus torazame TaxID=75743 RepID=A0A401Q860_SCYTO|nr:hypothetical protein [Scyliorhinus torazame]